MTDGYKPEKRKRLKWKSSCMGQLNGRTLKRWHCLVHASCLTSVKVTAVQEGSYVLWEKDSREPPWEAVMEWLGSQEATFPGSRTQGKGASSSSLDVSIRKEIFEGTHFPSALPHTSQIKLALTCFKIKQVLLSSHCDFLLVMLLYFWHYCFTNTLKAFPILLALLTHSQCFIDTSAVLMCADVGAINCPLVDHPFPHHQDALFLWKPWYVQTARILLCNPSFQSALLEVEICSLLLSFSVSKGDSLESVSSRPGNS